MGAIIPLLMGTILSIATFNYTFSAVNSEQTMTKVSDNKLSAVQLAISGLNLSKNDLSKDYNWNDGEGFDDENNENFDSKSGLKYARSNILDAKLKNYKEGDGYLSVTYLPISSSQIAIISKGVIGDTKVILGTVFGRQTENKDLPVVYSGSSYLNGGDVCSYSWDKDNEEVGGVTMPDVTAYLDKKFFWSPNFIIPEQPAADNKKDISFFVQGDVTVTGYKVIDNIHAGGDITLRYGAEVGNAYSDGQVNVDSSSNAGVITENGTYKHPSFASSFDDFTFNETTDGKTYYCTGSTNCDQYSDSSTNCSPNTGSYGITFDSNNYANGNPNTWKNYAWSYGWNHPTVSCNKTFKAQSIKKYRKDCKKGKSARKNYNICLNTPPKQISPQNCLANGGGVLPEGSYGKLVVEKGCNLELSGEKYSIGTIEINNKGTINITNNKTQLLSKNIYIGLGNNNTDADISFETSDPQNFIQIQSENIQYGKGGKLSCKDPKTCLIDTNDLTMSSTSSTSSSNHPVIQGTVLVRNHAEFNNGELIGNIMAESMNATNSKFCNVVDKSGNQQVANQTFFDIINPNGTALNSMALRISTVICQNETNCLNNLVK